MEAQCSVTELSLACRHDETTHTQQGEPGTRHEVAELILDTAGIKGRHHACTLDQVYGWICRVSASEEWTERAAGLLPLCNVAALQAERFSCSTCSSLLWTSFAYAGIHIHITFVSRRVNFSRELVLTADVGNNYAITNESRTRTARIFFAQGCEVESSG